MSRPWFYIVWFFTLLHLVDCQWVVGKHIFCCLWRSKMRGEDSTISPSTPPSSLPECRAKHYEDKNYKEHKRRRKAFIIFSIFVSWNMIVFYASPPKINDNIECLMRQQTICLIDKACRPRAFQLKYRGIAFFPLQGKQRKQKKSPVFLQWKTALTELTIKTLIANHLSSAAIGEVLLGRKKDHTGTMIRVIHD